VRPHHNFAPPDSFELVAEVLRRHVDLVVFDRMLDRLPEAAALLWRPHAQSDFSGHAGRLEGVTPVDIPR
jgi:hypothetical protein